MFDILANYIVCAALSIAIYAFWMGMNFYEGFFWVVVGTIPVAIALLIVLCALEHLWDGVVNMARKLAGKPDPDEDSSLTKWVRTPKSAHDHLQDFKNGVMLIPATGLMAGPLAILVVPEASILALVMVLGVFGLHHYLNLSWFVAVPTSIVGGCILCGLWMMISEWNYSREWKRRA